MQFFAFYANNDAKNLDISKKSSIFAQNLKRPSAQRNQQEKSWLVFTLSLG